MAKKNYALCLSEVLQHEGGYVNHPRDPGGATNRGVTQATYDRYRQDNNLRKQSVRAITETEVAAIYRLRYWNKVQGDALPGGLDLATFDGGVNSGPSRGAKWLQKAVGATADGAVGPLTLKAAVAVADYGDTVKAMCAARMGFLRRLGHWSTFGKGWTRRVARVEAVGVKLAVAAMAERAAGAPEYQPDFAESSRIEGEFKGRATAEVGAATADAAKKDKQSKAAGTGGVAAGGTTGTEMADPSTLDLPLWVTIGLGVATVALLVFAVYLLYRIHVQRERIRAYEEAKATVS